MRAARYVWLMVDAHRAVAEVTTHCQHRGTGVSLQTVKANFWTIESGWPVRLNEYYDIGDIQVFISAVSARVSA